MAEDEDFSISKKKKKNHSPLSYSKDKEFFAMQYTLEIYMYMNFFLKYSPTFKIVFS